MENGAAGRYEEIQYSDGGDEKTGFFYVVCIFVDDLKITSNLVGARVGEAIVSFDALRRGGLAAVWQSVYHDMANVSFSTEQRGKCILVSLIIHTRVHSRIELTLVSPCNE